MKKIVKGGYVYGNSEEPITPNTNWIRYIMLKFIKLSSNLHYQIMDKFTPGKN